MTALVGLTPPAWLLALATLVLSTSAARAGGLFVPDVGTRALGRGGAVVASGDDPTALWYNPANLAAGKGVRVELDVTLNFRGINWQRAPDPTVQDEPFAPVDNSRAPPIPVPGLFGAWDVGVPGLAVALGVYAPMNGTLRYDEDGPQRYTAIRSGSFVIFFHAGVAYEITPWLRVGAGLFLNSVFFDQRLALNLGLGRPEDPTWDVKIDVEGTQHALVNGNVGLWLAPGAGFEIGGSFFPGRRARATGTASVEAPEVLKDLLVVKGNQADFEMDFPFFLRAGVAWRWTRPDAAGRTRDLLVLEADYVHEGWSSLQAINVYPRDVSISLPPFVVDRQITDLSLQRGWKDTHSIRAGAEGLVYEPWNLVGRAGYYWESGAVPNSLLSVSSTDTDKHGVSAGVGIELGRFKLSLAYAHVFFKHQNVTDSQMRLTNPLKPGEGNIIGNGLYKFDHDLLSFGVQATF